MSVPEGRGEVSFLVIKDSNLPGWVKNLDNNEVLHSTKLVHGCYVAEVLP